MSPSEFKETLKHTLGLKVTPPQLGALTHLFGTGGGAEDGDSSEGGEGYHGGHGHRRLMKQLATLTCVPRVLIVLPFGSLGATRPHRVLCAPEHNSVRTATGVFAPQVQIDVSRFLTTFFKMSAAVKGMSVGRDAALRIAEYRVALKVSGDRGWDSLRPSHRVEKRGPRPSSIGDPPLLMTFDR